jgi:hypothetical protein
MAVSPEPPRVDRARDRGRHCHTVETRQTVAQRRRAPPRIWSARSWNLASPRRTSLPPTCCPRSRKRVFRLRLRASICSASGPDIGTFDLILFPESLCIALTDRLKKTGPHGDAPFATDSEEARMLRDVLCGALARLRPGRRDSGKRPAEPPQRGEVGAVARRSARVSA